MHLNPPNAASGPLLIVTFLAAAVLVVALFKALRLSPVLGYLTAGALIGPKAAHFVTQVDSASAIAEYGVMFLLFLIGLELSYERLHALSKRVYAVGLLQILLTSAFLAFLLRQTNMPWITSFIIGGGLALSSTAFVMELIAEHGQKATQLGRLALAALLIQDLAVVPLLVLVPAFAHPQGESVWHILASAGLRASAMLVVILLAGRVILRPLYRMIASLESPEIFTALTLLLVLGTGWLTSVSGLSLAMGAFLAGLMLAETEYRHQVEADVLPYKSLFLGLFFMTIGMSADLDLLWRHGFLLIGAALGLMLVKTLLLFFLCRLFRFSLSLSFRASFLLSQGGEFAFILFRLAAAEHYISASTSSILMLTVTISMALTPLAAFLGRRFAVMFDQERRRAAMNAAPETSDLRDHVR
jgi:CPA2 family monovalent cation:H+ antiporter-2